MTESKRPDRRHIRYRDSNNAHINLVRRTAGDEQVISSLIVDQCYFFCC